MSESLCWLQVHGKIYELNDAFKKIAKWNSTLFPKNVQLNTARKVSVFEVILIRIQSECGKARTRITPNTDTFYAAKTNVKQN